MARVQFIDAMIDSAGNALTNGTVRVELRDTSTLATLYVAETGPSTKANPFAVTDGIVEFWIDTGKYDVLLEDATVPPIVADRNVAFDAIAHDDVPGVGTALIQNADIANDAINAAKIAADAVGSSELANDAVDTAAIVNNAVTPGKATLTSLWNFATGMLQLASMRVHRHPYGNDRHIESGTVSGTTPGGGSFIDVALTFTDAYASTPVLSAIAILPATDVQIVSKSTTGATLRINGPNSTSVSADWHAEGAD